MKRLSDHLVSDSSVSHQSSCSEGPRLAVPTLDHEDRVILAEGSRSNGAMQAEMPAEQVMKTHVVAWSVPHFSLLLEKNGTHTEVFRAGDCSWRLLFRSRGCARGFSDIHLEVADVACLPNGRRMYAQISLSVISQKHIKYTITKEGQHWFSDLETKFGFIEFMPLSALCDQNRGYIVDDTCKFTAEVTVCKLVDYVNYTAPKETGGVGLINDGDTSYLNTLIQSLYHIPLLRKAVYSTSTSPPKGMSCTNVALAMKMIFHNLQYSCYPVATKALFKILGWDKYNQLMHNHLQEFEKDLLEELRDSIKDSGTERTKPLFEGHCMNYTQFINADRKLMGMKSFYSIEVDVRGCQDVYESFDKYCKDAENQVLFIDFPLILKLKLRRFEYNSEHDTIVKINDRYEFPMKLDLDRGNGKYLSRDADRNFRNLYVLQSVLVHSGGVHGGHYCAFIRPTLCDQWLKFDDEWVTEVDARMAVENQYGGASESIHMNDDVSNPSLESGRHSNAYELVYICKREKDTILCTADENDIGRPFREMLNGVLETWHEMMTIYKAHRSIIIKVAGHEDLMRQIGKNINFDLVDYEKVQSFHFDRHVPFSVFKEKVAEEFDIPVQCQRFWLWVADEKSTYQLHRPLTPQEQAQTVGWLGNIFSTCELNLFLQVNRGTDHLYLPPPQKNEHDILLFLKVYDPEKENVRYAGMISVKASEKPSEAFCRLNEMGGFHPNSEIELYEERVYEPSVLCKLIDKEVSFQCNQLKDGKIIWYQKSPSPEEAHCRYPNVPSFLAFLNDRRTIQFRSLKKPAEDSFHLELSKLVSYDEVVGSITERLDLDEASTIHLFLRNSYFDRPNTKPTSQFEHLSDILCFSDETIPLLYYGTLGTPVPEAKHLRALTITFHHATKDEAVTHGVLLLKGHTISAVTNELKTNVELSHPNAELRMLVVAKQMIRKIFLPSYSVAEIHNGCSLHAHEISRKENNLAADHWLVYVYHITRLPTQKKGRDFWEPSSMGGFQSFGKDSGIVIHDRDTFAMVKACIQKEVLMPKEEFAKVRFYFFPCGGPVLRDCDVLSDWLQENGPSVVRFVYLGLGC